MTGLMFTGVVLLLDALTAAGSGLADWLCRFSAADPHEYDGLDLLLSPSNRTEPKASFW